MSGILDRFNDPDVAGAAAQVSNQGIADFEFGWMRIAVQQSPGRDQHTWSTETTLHASGFDDLCLDWIQLSILSQAFYGGD
jgi:hypothetical protein